jgi:hypothetical protein
LLVLVCFLSPEEKSLPLSTAKGFPFQDFTQVCQTIASA